MKTVRCRIKNEINSGNRKGWSKLVTSVDMTKTNGYAFIGDFIPDDTEVELPVGGVLVQKNPQGSVKHSWDSGHVYIVEGDGKLYEILDNVNQINARTYHWTKDFLSLRDLVAKCLAEQTEQKTIDLPSIDWSLLTDEQVTLLLDQANQEMLRRYPPRTDSLHPEGF